MAATATLPTSLRLAASGRAIETRQGRGHARQRGPRRAIGWRNTLRRRQPTAQAAHTSTSAGKGWPRKAVGLAVKP